MSHHRTSIKASPSIVDVIADLLRGNRHCRTSVSTLTGVSLPTADRWLAIIMKKIPGARKTREGKTTWLQIRA